MIDGLKPYPAIKNSGVPWLGDVPEHWDVKRGKALFRCIDVRSSTGVEELLTVSSERGVILRSSANVTMFKAESYVGHKLCWPGDLVINSLWAWARGLGVSRHHGIVSSAYGVYRLRPDYADWSPYIHELVRSTPFNWELQVRSKGIWISRLQLTDEAFLGAPFPLPPADDCAAIVRFLDHADGRIRRYIRAKQKLIKLLEEQKQAIIHRTVTRGLDSSVRLKPSGVEWLGDIPAHWEVMRVKYVARMESGHTPSRSTPGHWLDQNDIPWVSLNDTKQLDRVDYISDTALHINELGLRNSSARLLPEGVVVFTRDAAVGKAAITTRPMAVSQHLIAWVCGPRILNSYLLRVFYAMTAELSRFTFGATIATIGMDDVRKLVTSVPPIAEQHAIASHLESACAGITKSLTGVRAELDVLREYRTRLIADVVTGKLDVREAAAKLPDEAPEGEPLDEIEELLQDDSVAADIDVEAADAA